MFLKLQETMVNCVQFRKLLLKKIITLRHGDSFVYPLMLSSLPTQGCRKQFLVGPWFLQELAIGCLLLIHAKKLIKMFFLRSRAVIQVWHKTWHIILLYHNESIKRSI